MNSVAAPALPVGEPPPTGNTVAPGEAGPAPETATSPGRPSAAATKGPTATRAPDCATVIYSPGLFEKEDGKSLAHFAERMARALDQQDKVAGLKFAAQPARLETCGDETRKREVEVREIVRTATDGRREITHRIYYLDYESELVAAKTEGNWFTEAWALGSTLWIMGMRYATVGLRTKSLGPNQKAALAVAGAALALLTAAFVFALVQALAALGMDAPMPEFSWDWFWNGLAETARLLEPVTRPIGGDHVDRFVAWSVVPVSWVAQLISALVAGMVGAAHAIWSWLNEMQAWLVVAGGGLLSLKRVRAELARGLDIFLLSTRYFIAGRGRVKCTGRFHELLEHIVETNAGRVDVVGYSMGSLVALDSLFPWTGMPSRRSVRVRTLTTIGCPFDFVRSFWPDYFEGRAQSPPDLKWINVYSPLDLLGSNFANDTGPMPEAKRGINESDPMTKDSPEAPSPPPRTATRPHKNLLYDHLGRRELRLTEAWSGEAFSAHSQYWVRGDPDADSCLEAVVSEIYDPAETKTPPPMPGPASP